MYNGRADSDDSYSGVSGDVGDVSDGGDNGDGGSEGDGSDDSNSEVFNDVFYEHPSSSDYGMPQNTSNRLPIATLCPLQRTLRNPSTLPKIHSSLDNTMGSHSLEPFSLGSALSLDDSSEQRKNSWSFQKRDSWSFQKRVSASCSFSNTQNILPNIEKTIDACKDQKNTKPKRDQNIELRPTRRVHPRLPWQLRKLSRDDEEELMNGGELRLSASHCRDQMLRENSTDYDQVNEELRRCRYLRTSTSSYEMKPK